MFPVAEGRLTLTEGRALHVLDDQTFEVRVVWDNQYTPTRLVEMHVEALSAAAEITRATLAGMPWGSLLAACRADAIRGARDEASQLPECPAPGVDGSRPVSASEARASADGLAALAGKRRTRVDRLPDELLIRVAAAYDEAVRMGDPAPVRYVARTVIGEAEHDAHGRASSWVRVAERRGFLQRRPAKTSRAPGPREKEGGR